MIVAITHAPSPKMAAAVRTFIDVEPIDLARVATQHAAYRAALERAGARVIELRTNLDFPDAVFIEDTAIVLDELAILTSPGTPSRANEPAGIEPELRKHRAEVARIEPPATLDGGDVLRVGRTLFVGSTGRTNAAGIESLTRLAGRHGYDVRPVPVTGCLHLKTACTALPDGTLLLNPRWVELADREFLPIDESEPHAANLVLLGDRIVMSSAYPRTLEKIRARGFDVDPVDLSELAKAEGAGTCLSLIFRATA